MNTGAGLGLAVVTLVGMEGVAYLTHRYLMHGRLWGWHRSHHSQQSGWFELNDLFAVIFALLSVVMIYAGSPDYGASFWLGLGMIGYGIIYALFHDGLVHGRIPLPRALKRLPYLRHLVIAHYLHHATHLRHGAVSYGFLFAPPLERLREGLRAASKARVAAPPQRGDRV